MMKLSALKKNHPIVQRESGEYIVDQNYVDNNMRIQQMMIEGMQLRQFRATADRLTDQQIQDSLVVGNYYEDAVDTAMNGVNAMSAVRALYKARANKPPVLPQEPIDEVKKEVIVTE